MPQLSTRNGRASHDVAAPPDSVQHFERVSSDTLLDHQVADVDVPRVASSPQDRDRSKTVSPPEQEDWSFATKELLDALPQRWTRGLLYLLMLFVAVGLPWTMLSEVEETGSARGWLEPQGDTVKVEANVGGKVATVHVKEGGTVNANAVLLELDTEALQFELRQAQARLEGLQNRVAQLEPIKHQLDIAINAQKLQSQAQQSEQQAQIRQTEQRMNSLKTLLPLEQNRLQKAQENVQRYQGLADEGAISRREVYTAEEERDERDKILGQVKADMQQAETELEKQQSAYDGVVQAGELTILQSQRQVKELQAQITEMHSEIEQTKSQIQAQKHQLQQRVIRAPIGGTIFELPNAKIGAVIQPDQLVAEIAPQQTKLILKAQMATPESGFLEDGMPVKVKFDAYPFQDYGAVAGKLMQTAPMAKMTDTAEGQVSTFELEVVLAQDCIATQSDCIPLKPGDTATAEVIVRKRRLIDFILDPFRKLQKGGLEL